MKPFIQINFFKKYDGEYFHYGSLLGIEYMQADFDYEDRYKQIRVGLIFIEITIGIRS